MFRSATFKLTLWYIAIVMAISLSFSVVLYNEATNELSRGLHRQTARISQQFPVFQGDPLLRPGPDYSDATHRILLRLVGFNVIVLFGAGLSSYWLARRTLRPIEEAHEQQKRFTADVSHELRTPLTVLRMESEVALLNPNSNAKELRQTLGSNLEEVAKLEALINNLLRLTRLEADELRQNFVPLSAQAMAAAALKQVRPLAERRHIKLSSKLTDSSPSDNKEGEMVDNDLNGDFSSLVQLVVILLDNAIKYSPSASTVTLSAHTKANDVVLAVTDHGPGLSKAALERAFDRFYRADESRAKAGDANTEGFGLGLSIAKMIADLHDGTIILTSRLGHGTTATISLPRRLGNHPVAPDLAK
jgi:two-component system, OmpR family, sensor histidine kinase CiaH